MEGKGCRAPNDDGGGVRKDADVIDSRPGA
jgi:hypothetical protein